MKSRFATNTVAF